MDIGGKAEQWHLQQFLKNIVLRLLKISKLEECSTFSNYIGPNVNRSDWVGLM